MKSLLVVVDMQRDFVSGPLGTKEAQNILPAVVRRIQEFQGDVVYTRDSHNGNYLQTQEGPPGWEIVPEVRDAGKGKTVAVIDKPTFGSVALCDFVEAGGYTAVELVGLCTDICVISNALCLKARLWEIPISVRVSCCAGVTPESHENALAAMKMCQIHLV